MIVLHFPTTDWCSSNMFKWIKGNILKGRIVNLKNCITYINLNGEGKRTIDGDLVSRTTIFVGNFSTVSNDIALHVEVGSFE